MVKNSEQRAASEAARRWWLTEEEIELYGARSPEYQSRFLSFQAWDRVVRRGLTEPAWEHLLNNKWFFAHTFTNLGLPVARPLGLIHPTGGTAVSGDSLRTADEFVHWRNQRSLSSFVMKPVAGWSSEGVMVIDDVYVHNGVSRFLLSDGTIHSPQQLFASFQEIRRTSGYLVEERLRLRPDLTRIGLGFPHSLRIVTVTLPARDPEVVMAVASVGRRGKMVNQWSSGSLTVHIDVESGELGRGRTLPQFGREWHTSHPDNSEIFTGKHLPDWDESLDICVRAARSAPGCPITCWEIILTDKGPRLLEVNLGFGIAQFQVHTDGFRQHRFGELLEQLGADLPDGTRRWVKDHMPPSYPQRIAMLAKRNARAPIRSARRFVPAQFGGIHK